MNIFHVATKEDSVYINKVCANLGKGSENLGILLLDASGNEYLSCHSSAWTAEDYEIFVNRTGFSEFCTNQELEALDRLKESVEPDSPDYIATEHIARVLEEWGLHKPLEQGEL